MQKGIRGGKVFSQNDEDGAIEDVFKHIGTTNKVMVGLVFKKSWQMKSWIEIEQLTRCTLNLELKTVSNATADTLGL